jgi:hypothetical protein
VGVLVLNRLIQKAKAMIVLIYHQHAPRRHGHHTVRVVELPERRTLAAPGPRALQLTGNALRPTQSVSTSLKTRSSKAREEKLNEK